MPSKFCKKCNQSKEITFFRKDKTTKDGYSFYCSECKRIDALRYYRENKEKVNKVSKVYYQKNKEKCNLATSLWSKENKDYINEKQRNKVGDLKQRALAYKGNKCVFCGYNKSPKALHFHHINPLVKKDKLSTMFKNYMSSWEIIQEELDKCVLVCSNCHAEIHAGIINIGELV